MNIRPKTLRRLLILFAGLLAIAGTLTGIVLYSLHKRDVQLTDLRRQAFAAYEAHDYSRSVGLFGSYFALRHAQDSDPDALLAFAKSRANTPLENGRHIFDAISWTEQYLQERGDDADAQHLLLGLYARVAYNKEAKLLAAKLLAKNPNDLDALRADVQALSNDHNYEEALKTCRRLNQLAPLDITFQWDELELMSKLKQDPKAIVAHARSLNEQHPNDARFEALMAVAYGLAGDAENSRKSLEAAAKLEPADPETVLRIVGLLDREGRFDLSENLLDRAVAKSGDPRVLRRYVQRQWEQQRYDEVVRRTGGAMLRSPDTDATMLGYRAVALYESHKTVEAAAVVALLSSRQDDASKGWATALQARYANPPLTAATLIQKYGEALAHDTQNPVFHSMLADALNGIGETDKAREEWLAAARLSPTWAAPLIQISRMLSAAGRFSEAIRFADAARERAPSNSAAQLAYTVSWYGISGRSITDPNSPDVQNLLKRLEEIQTALPNEPVTLVPYASMLAQLGQKDKAIEVVKKAIAAEPPPSNDTFARLTKLSRDEHLGLEDLLLDRAEKVQGLTPAITFARAMSLYDAGRQKDALDLLANQRQTHPREPAWLLAEAQFRDLVHDPDAIRSWTDLADGNPADLFIQYSALKSPTRFTDRAFWRRTIDRVKTLTGDSGKVWKLEDARWRLSDPVAQDVEPVINSLRQIVRESPELADAHRLLGQALLRGNQPDSLAKATAELTTANDLQPGDFETLSQITRLLAMQGKQDAAVQLVDGVVKQQRLEPRQRLWAAETYAELGHNAAAIKLLTEADDATPADPARESLLAMLYRRTGKLSEAERVYLRILNEPNPEPNALGNAAEFFASRHQPQIESRFLDRLSKMPMRPGTLEMVKAHLEELYGSPQTSLELLQSAAKAHPQAEQIWQELAGFYLRHNELDQAESTTAEGLRAIPASPLLQATREQIGRLRVVNGPGLATLVEVIAHDPGNPAASDALRLLAEAHTRGDSAAKTAADLRQLAGRYPQFLPLQELLVQRYVALAQYKDAVEVANRASEVSPNSAEPLRLLCAVYSAAGDWPAARQAATRWKQKVPSNPVEADLTIATTYLQQQQAEPAAAVNQLAPYVADSQPQELRQAVLPVYCRALVMAGRSAEASALLEPLLAQAPQWRLIWLELSSAGQKDEQAASEWIGKVTPLLQKDSVPERLALTAAWQQVGIRFDSQKAFEQARGAIEPVLARPPVSAAAWQLAASVWQSLDDLPRAEDAWRQALRMNPTDASLQNNLAYVLLRRGGPERLAEAEKLSTAAILLAPGVSTFYDTLARIQVQENKPDLAIKSFRTALEKDPNNVEAMIGLADVLGSRAPDRSEARALVVRINAAMQSGSPVPPPVRKQFERVKSALTSNE